MKTGSLYWPTRTVSSPFRRSWFNIELEGAENVPATGPLVLAANHISFLDSFLLMNALDRKVIFLGKAEYLDSWKTRMFPAAGMIPVDRSGKAIMQSLGEAAEILESGGAIGIFPEGTRTTSGAVHKGHGGAAYLAFKSHAALVPVGIIGTDRAQPPGSRFPNRGATVRFRFGAPIGLSDHGRGARARTAVTRELMHSIAVLSGRPYRNTPAPARAPQPTAVPV